MKVSTIGIPFKKQKSYKMKRGQEGNFSSDFNLAQKEFTNRDLKEKLQKINALGDEIKDKPGLDKIKQYRQYIKEYLSFVLKHYYRMRQDYGVHSAHLLTRVEIINKKIEALTNNFMEQQRENIDLVSRIDEIAGLLVDLYG